MRKCRVWVKTALCALAVVAGGAGLVAAQEVSLSNLALKNTYLIGALRATRAFLVEEEYLQFDRHHVPGHFRNVHRSGRGSVQFETGNVLDLDKGVRCRVIRGGVLSTIVARPGDVRFTVGGDATFPWVFTGVSFGTHTITVQCTLEQTAFSHIWAMKRNLTIDVYKN